MEELQGKRLSDECDGVAGRNAAFSTTHWSVVLSAGGASSLSDEWETPRLCRGDSQSLTTPGVQRPGSGSLCQIGALAEGLSPEALPQAGGLLEGSRGSQRREDPRKALR